MRISDWSSDVCSSDLATFNREVPGSNPGGPTTFSHRCESFTRAASPFAARILRASEFPDRANWRVWSVHRPPKQAPGMRRDVPDAPGRNHDEIGRASCRERVCQYVSISVVDATLKNKNKASPTKAH